MAIVNTGISSRPMILTAGEYFGNGNAIGDAKATAGNFITGQIYASPIWLPKPTLVDELAVWCLAAAGGGTYTAGIYNVDSGGKPSNLIWGIPSGKTVSSAGISQVSIPNIRVPENAVFAFALENNADDFTHYDEDNTVPFITAPLLTAPNKGRGSPGVIASWTYDAGNLPAIFPTAGFASRYQAVPFQLRVA